MGGVLRRIAFILGQSGTTTCACGRVWDLIKHKVKVRDIESVECKCGRTLKSWNGQCFWLSELVKDIERSKEEKGRDA